MVNLILMTSLRLSAGYAILDLVGDNNEKVITSNSTL